MEDRPRGAVASTIPERQLGRIAANSAAMDEVFGAVKGLAPSNVPVTLIGETGTGKDVLAHAIHDTSLRPEGPFIVFDCGAVPANLV